MINENQLDKFVKLFLFYNIGDRLASVKHISVLTGLNKYSVYKLIKGLVSIGSVEKFNNRFFVIDPNPDTSPAGIQKRLINKAIINLNILKLLQKNFIYDKETVSFIEQNGMYFNIYFPIKAKKVSLNISDIDKHPNYEISQIIKRCKLK